MGLINILICVSVIVITACGKNIYENNPFLIKVPIVPVLPNVVHQPYYLNNQEKQHIQQVIPPAVQQPGLHTLHHASHVKNQNEHISVHGQAHLQEKQYAYQAIPPAVQQPGLHALNPSSYIKNQEVHHQQHVQLHHSQQHNHQPSPPAVVYQESHPEGGLRQYCLRSRGQFPNSKCNKFVNCWDNTAAEQFCPEGLAFNPAGYCDYIQNVDCKGRSFEFQPGIQVQPSIVQSSTPNIINYQPAVVNQGAAGIQPQNPFLPQTTQIPVVQQPGAQFPVVSNQLPSTNAPFPTVPAGSTPVLPLNPFLPINVSQLLWETNHKPTVVHQPLATNKPPILSSTPATLVPANGGYPSPSLNPFLPTNVSQILWQTTQRPTITQQPINFITNPPSASIIPPISVPPPANQGNLPSQLNPFLPVNVSQVLFQNSQKPSVAYPPVAVGNPSPNSGAPLNLLPSGTAPVNPLLRAKCHGLRGQFPSDSCNKYVDCWDGNAIELDCPPGLLFSERGYCDYPANVNCQNRDVIKTSAPKNPQCPSPNGTFKDKSNCTKYFTCISDQIVSKYECPVGLYFNEVICVCDYAQNVNCSREPFVYQPPNKIETLQKVPAVAVDTTLECKPGRVFRLKPDCSSVVLCRSGSTEAVHCPAGLFYDAPTDRCLPQQLARCQDS